MDSHDSPEQGWLEQVGRFQPVLAEMLARKPGEQKRLGYFHTLLEICQQPAAWTQTAKLMQESAREISAITVNERAEIRIGHIITDVSRIKMIRQIKDLNREACRVFFRDLNVL